MKISNRWMKISAMLFGGGTILQLSGCLGDFATGFFVGSADPVLNFTVDFLIEELGG